MANLRAHTHTKHETLEYVKTILNKFTPSNSGGGGGGRASAQNGYKR